MFQTGDCGIGQLSGRSEALTVMTDSAGVLFDSVSKVYSSHLSRVVRSQIDAYYRRFL